MSASAPTRPSGNIKPVTASDSTDLPDGPCRGFHVNVAGDVCFIDLSGNTVTLTVTAGAPLPYAVSRIKSTGTTATGIFALY